MGRDLCCRYKKVQEELAAEIIPAELPVYLNTLLQVSCPMANKMFNYLEDPQAKYELTCFS